MILTKSIPYCSFSYFSIFVWNCFLCLQVFTLHQTVTGYIALTLEMHLASTIDANEINKKQIFFERALTHFKKLRYSILLITFFNYLGIEVNKEYIYITVHTLMDTCGKKSCISKSCVEENTLTYIKINVRRYKTKSDCKC